jgi:hypothetical protein
MENETKEQKLARIINEQADFIFYWRCDLLLSWQELFDEPMDLRFNG